MNTFTFELTDAQMKALAHVAIDPKEWIGNMLKTRCDAAIDTIVNAEVQRKLATGEAISGSKEEIVLAAPIKSAAEVQLEYEASLDSIHKHQAV